MAKREIKTIFAIDGETKYRDAIKSINKEQALLRAELRAVTSEFDASGDAQKKLSAQAESLAKQIELQKQKIAEAQHAVEQSTKIYGENSDTTKQYKIDLANAEAQLGRLQTTLAKTNKELILQQSRMQSTGEALEKAGKKIQDFSDKAEKVGNKLSTTITAPIVAGATVAVKSAMDFESAFAGVRKTVDATEEQFAELEQGIRDMAKEVPASAAAIAEVGEAAGQLGIQTENILGFTRVMIDLGEATNLTATEGAEVLAQFANVTQMSQKEFDRLGSTIVALGNNFATTEKDIVNMAQRLAGAGKQVGLSEAEIMALATALSSVGIEAEAGGSAMSKVLINMQLAATTGSKANEVISKTGMSLRDLQMLADQDAKAFKAMANSMGYTSTEFRQFIDASASLEAFSKVTGQSADQFKEAFEKDAVGALQAFIKNLSTANKRGEDAIEILTDMGITEVRMRDALLRSAGAGDVLAESVRLANKAWEENNALTKEAEQRYQTSESQMRIAKNTMQDAAITIGRELLPPLADLMKNVAGLAERFGQLEPEQQKTILSLLGVAAALGPVVKTTATLTDGIGKASEGIGKFIQKLAEKKAAEEAAKLATEGLTGAIGGGAGLTSVLGPLGIALGVTALAVAGLTYAYQESIKPAKEAGEAAVDFMEGVANWHDGVQQATSALQGFNMETIISAEKMTELESKINEAQQNIIGIAEKAAAESRAFTEEERKQIEELIGLIAEYTEQKIEAYQKQSEVVMAMATQERDMTIERANELIKAAEESKEQILAIAQARYAEEVALAEEMYGHLGEQDKAAYEQMIANAQKEYELRVQSANETYGDTLAIIQQKYADINAEDLKYLEQMAEAGEKVKQLEKEKTDYIAEQTEKRISDGQDALTQSVNYLMIEWEARQKYGDKINDAYKELEDAYEQAKDKNLDSWLGMVMHTELYGGRVDKKSKDVAIGIIDSFEHLPEDAKKTMKDTMDGMSKEMERKEPSLFKKASNIANGILNKLRQAFDIRSPSHKMQEITEQLFAGADKPIEEAGKKLPEKVGKIASNVLNEASRMLDTSSYLAARASRLNPTPIMASAVQYAGNTITTESKSSAKDTNLDSPVTITIKNMSVRDDSDIHKVAYELHRLQQQKQRGLGRLDL